MAEELAGGKLLLDEPAEAVARLTLNRPDSRNALDHETLNAIAEVMPTLDRGIELRCVILTGAGGIFSAGYDIGGFSADEFEAEAESLVAHPFARGLDAVAAHPWPVLCAINGHALGGALELTLCCDLRLCSRGAVLGMPPAKLGLIYGHTGLQRFIDAIGVPRTKELFLTGDNVTAERAAQIGLVNQLAGDDELESAAVELAAGIAANAPLSMRGNKHAIDTLNSHARLTPEQERELIELRESCFRSEDFREGVAAFAEKRKPVWKGK
ncbi:MAG TPA: enoyl-CoA hydratase-related protein [Solirubrobacterales bacterium]